MPHPGMLVLELSGISGGFAFLYDSLAQGAESCWGVSRKRKAWEEKEGEGVKKLVEEEEEEEDKAKCACECCDGGCRYDLGRTVRYTAVHLVWNGPYHVPKLLALNWLFPGAPSAMIALKKTLVADIFFSPVEALGVLVLVQLARDGFSCEHVPAKLRRDFLPYQLTKWAGHVPAHFLAFYSSNTVVGQFVDGFLYKSVFEIVMAVIVARQEWENGSGAKATTPAAASLSKEVGEAGKDEETDQGRRSP
eukprot:Hpha_TRINITY_DN15979_c4_g11::TRINITY_DN15979_c4_g11_i1::g.73425::m.73425